MTLTSSALLFAASAAGFLIFSALDKKSGQDRFRLATLLCGVMGMFSLFYLLIYLAAAAKKLV